MDAVEKAKCGHPGLPMGMADVATVLFSRFLKFDSAHPNWPDRDRFVLSAGHGSMVFYALPHLTGYPEMSMDQLTSFRQLGSKKAGHPFRKAGAENLCAKGAYRLKAAEAERKVILIATGSEVEIAVGVAASLEDRGIGADVVSMPCTEAFDAQPDAYREDLLPDVSNREILRVSIEAGTTFGWERYTGLHGLRIGIDRFGASAPAVDLYEYFGLTVPKITGRVLDHIKIREIA